MNEKKASDVEPETRDRIEEKIKSKAVQAHIREHKKYIRQSKPQLPKKLIIFSVEWDISYFDKQIEVDPNREEKQFGQVNYEDNAIRIFRGKRKRECIFETIFHEWLHIVITELGYEDVLLLSNKEEQFVEAISTALNDFFWRNFR